jgi:biopolymer transport protein ExbD
VNRRDNARRPRREEVELNLIPLIDIMSVMVAFLLVYSADVEVVQNSRDIRVPLSHAEEKPKPSVVVMITTDELLVQGERIASIDEIRAASSPGIDALSAVLTRPMVGADVVEELASREVTVIADKSLPYEVVKRVMATCTREGYGHISLAVLQKDSTQI